MTILSSSATPRPRPVSRHFLLVFFVMTIMTITTTTTAAQEDDASSSSSSVLPLTTIRSINGTDQAPGTHGYAGAPLLRVSHAQYPGDGSGSTIKLRPNPRAVSNAVNAVRPGAAPKVHPAVNDMLLGFAQFLDHDVGLTEGNAEKAGTADIEVTETGDVFGVGKFISFGRSAYQEGTGTGPENPRQFHNAITAYIDGSAVYGSDTEREHALRDETDRAMLKTSGRSDGTGDIMLPYNIPLLENAGGRTKPGLFLAGDVRANENVRLTAMHTLFVREHNRLARLIRDRYYGDSGDASTTTTTTEQDEEIYQLARKIVAAELQVITYDEYLPVLLGAARAPRSAQYRYDPAVDAGMAVEFSTAAYRYGHSMLQSHLAVAGPDLTVTNFISLADSFFDPSLITGTNGGLDKILLGSMAQRAQQLDVTVIDEVRNFLFGQPGKTGLDLPALNIQRGRDHGVPDYNSLREAYGLTAKLTFEDITTDPDTVASLRSVYDDVSAIDAWIGGLAEDPVADDALTGELFTAVIYDQFQRLRDGDRHFWYGDADLRDATLTADILDVATVTLADVMKHNAGLYSGYRGNSFLLHGGIAENA